MALPNLTGLGTRRDGIVPSEDLELRQGLVGPQGLQVTTILQALVVVLDGTHKVAWAMKLRDGLSCWSRW